MTPITILHQYIFHLLDNLLISLEIGQIFSTNNSANLFLKSEKFFPLNSFIVNFKL